jgi:hypothetical protein
MPDKKKLILLCFAAAFFLNMLPLAATEDFPPAKPESQGISSEALEKLSDNVRGYLESDLIVGAELLVIKNRRTILNLIANTRLTKIKQ